MKTKKATKAGAGAATSRNSDPSAQEHARENSNDTGPSMASEPFGPPMKPEMLDPITGLVIPDSPMEPEMLDPITGLEWESFQLESNDADRRGFRYSRDRSEVAADCLHWVESVVEVAAVAALERYLD